MGLTRNKKTNITIKTSSLKPNRKNGKYQMTIPEKTMVSFFDNGNRSIKKLEIKLGKDSHLEYLSYQKDESANLDIDILLLGEKSSARLYGLDIVSGNKTVNKTISIAHKAPKTTSYQLYKSIVTDDASYHFDSRISIKKSSKYSQAQQYNKNILLSDNARALSQPSLVIKNENVSCQHGIVSGKINDQALTYLRSRGLDPKISERIIITAFTDDLIALITDSKIRESTKTKVGATIQNIL